MSLQPVLTPRGARPRPGVPLRGRPASQMSIQPVEAIQQPPAHRPHPQERGGGSSRAPRIRRRGPRWPPAPRAGRRGGRRASEPISPGVLRVEHPLHRPRRSCVTAAAASASNAYCSASRRASARGVSLAGLEHAVVAQASSSSAHAACATAGRPDFPRGPDRGDAGAPGGRPDPEIRVTREQDARTSAASSQPIGRCESLLGRSATPACPALVSRQRACPVRGAAPAPASAGGRSAAVGRPSRPLEPEVARRRSGQRLGPGVGRHGRAALAASAGRRGLEPQPARCPRSTAPARRARRGCAPARAVRRAGAAGVADADAGRDAEEPCEHRHRRRRTARSTRSCC